MLGLAVRILGYAALAAAMVIGVLDGARGVADGFMRLSSLATVLDAVFPRALPAAGGTVGRLIHPAFWDPGVTTLLLAPATPALFALGLVLLLAGRRARGAILPPR